MLVVLILGAGFIFLVWMLGKFLCMFQVPEALRDIPVIPTIPYLKSLLRGESVDVRYKTLLQPIMQKRGVGRLWIKGQWELIVNHPQLVREILGNSDHFLKNDKRNFHQEKTLEVQILGFSNILFADGKEWRRHRKVANPAFKQSWPPNLFGDLVWEAFQVIKESGQPLVDVDDLVKKISLDALGKGLFSYDFNAIKNAQHNHHLTLYNTLFAKMFDPVFDLFPWFDSILPSRRLAYGHGHQFRMFLQDIIDLRRSNIQHKVGKDDLLSRMIISQQNGESDLTDEELINDLSIFFLAGHDTTSNTLSTIFYYLAKHQDIQQQLRAEILSVLNNPASVVVPTTDQLKQMNYLNCVIKEAMRIIATASVIVRCCHQHQTLSDGTQIPKYTRIYIDNWALHHHPDYFPDSGTFNPDRFTNNLNDINFIGFGYGTRMCIGSNFSLLEQRIIISMFLQHYQINLPSDASPSPPRLNTFGLLRIVDNHLLFHPLSNSN